MSRPEISVVVVTRGPSLALARLLRSLGKAEAMDSAELLIGLNGDDGVQATTRLAERWLPDAGVRIHRFPNLFPGDARNEVARLATAPLLLFLDDDVEAPAGLIAEARAAMDDLTVVAAGGPNLTPPASGEFERLAGRVLSSPLVTGPISHRYRVGPARNADERDLMLCNLVVRKQAFLDAGFDAGLACAEENDLLERLARADGRIVYRPELVVYHHRRPTLGSYARQIAKYGFGRGQLMVRAPSVRQLTYAVPTFALLAPISLAAAGLEAAAIAAIAAYAVLLALGAVFVGRAARGPMAFALALATHLAYALALPVGMAYELRRLGRPDRRRVSPLQAGTSSGSPASPE